MTQPRTLIIQPTRGWRSIDLGELWAYRELLFIFAWRDIKVRYRQTLLGAVWVMGQPLVSMLIFTLLFGRVAKLSVTTPVPYPVFVLAGLLLWNYVSGAINHVGNSLLGASYLISKAYFPRLVVPLSNLATDLVDFVIAAVLLVPVMLWYRVMPGLSIVIAPLIVFLATLFALGLGLWIAALNIEYRDVRIVIPWILQIAMYVTPVVYPLAALPERYRLIATLNPMSGIVEGFRATLFGTAIPLQALGWSAIASIVLLITGAFYFRRAERRFADVL
jgi:lipopolysaccharide transport system permease protein